MKKVLISIFTLIFIISMITVVNAASGSISATASVSQVTKGNTFTVTISGTADENITGMQASFSYDTSKLSLESKSAGTGFSDLSGTNEIAITSTGSEVKSGTLYTLTFKVLNTAELGETTVSISGVTLALVDSNQTQQNVTAANSSATVKIIEDETTIDNGSKTNTTPTEDTSTKTNGTGSNSEKDTSSKTISTKSTSSSSSKKLPQTGAEVGSIIGIAALSIIAVISYVAYRKYKNI